ncbi:unnamed protein product [Colias eurytheme]|nr:unnamed protein product [Colias eurytheme]
MDSKVVFLLAIMLTTSACYSLPDSYSLFTKCPCDKMYFPVCSSDGNSFNNHCEFNCYKKTFERLYGQQLMIVKEKRCDE